MEVLFFLPSALYPLCVFDLRATHARALLPEALAENFGSAPALERTSGRGSTFVRGFSFRWYVHAAFAMKLCRNIGRVGLAAWAIAISMLRAWKHAGKDVQIVGSSVAPPKTA